MELEALQSIFPEEYHGVEGSSSEFSLKLVPWSADEEPNHGACFARTGLERWGRGVGERVAHGVQWEWSCG